MSKTQRLIFLLAMMVCLVINGVVHAKPSPLSPSGIARTDALSIVYDPESGHVVTSPPEGKPLTAFELRSSGELFTANCDNLGGVFDVCKTNKVFKMATAGFEAVDLGAILPAGLSGAELLDDLLVDGATFGGGFYVGEGKLLVHPEFVPEPFTGTMLGLGALLLSATLRRRSRN